MTQHKISLERCCELWETKGPQWHLHTTPEECAYIKEVWSHMKPSTCFMDAFFRIWRENEQALLEQKKRGG